MSRLGSDQGAELVLVGIRVVLEDAVGSGDGEGGVLVDGVGVGRCHGVVEAGVVEVGVAIGDRCRQAGIAGPGFSPGYHVPKAFGHRRGRGQEHSEGDVGGEETRFTEIVVAEGLIAGDHDVADHVVAGRGAGNSRLLLAVLHGGRLPLRDLVGSGGEILELVAAVAAGERRAANGAVGRIGADKGDQDAGHSHLTRIANAVAVTIDVDDAGNRVVGRGRNGDGYRGRILRSGTVFDRVGEGFLPEFAGSGLVADLAVFDGYRSAGRPLGDRLEAQGLAGIGSGIVGQNVDENRSAVVQGGGGVVDGARRIVLGVDRDGHGGRCGLARSVGHLVGERIGAGVVGGRLVGERTVRVQRHTAVGRLGDVGSGEAGTVGIGVVLEDAVGGIDGEGAIFIDAVGIGHPRG